MTKTINAYYCPDCQKESFLTEKSKKVCPDCQSKLLFLDCTSDEYQSFTKDEQEIIIESNLLKERKKKENSHYKIENPDADNAKLLQKIAADTAITKWCIIGFSLLAIAFYILEEMF